MERQPLITQILSHIVDVNRDDIDKTLVFLTLKEKIFPGNKFLYFGVMLRNKERITLCPFIGLNDGSILFGRECIDGTLIIWNDVLYGNLPLIACHWVYQMMHFMCVLQREECGGNPV